MTIRGIGPIAATAITALVPAAEGFGAGRGFVAWVGLTPSHNSTGSKQKLGAIWTRGGRTVRRLLILGASAVVRKPASETHLWAHAGSDAAAQAEMLVRVALAN